MRIIRAKNDLEMSRRAANLIAAQLLSKPSSVLGLATGSTPLGVYRELIEWYQRGDLDFSQAKSVNLDEYCGLSPACRQSYRYYMNKNFFEHVNIRLENTYLPDGLSVNPDEEAARYDRQIRRLGGIDLQLLGIGNTGHIGFNEPADVFTGPTHVEKLNPRTVEANSRFFDSPDQVPEFAITMGITPIMQAQKIILLASGARKAEILFRACFGPITPFVPASILQVHRDVTVVADEDALSLILRDRPEFLH